MTHACTHTHTQTHAHTRAHTLQIQPGTLHQQQTLPGCTGAGVDEDRRPVVASPFSSFRNPRQRVTKPGKRRQPIRCITWRGRETVTTREQEAPSSLLLLPPGLLLQVVVHRLFFSLSMRVCPSLPPSLLSSLPPSRTYY